MRSRLLVVGRLAALPSDRDWRSFPSAWGEIENRAMALLGRYGKKGDCFSLHTPADLNDPERILRMLDGLGLEKRSEQIRFPSTKNGVLGRGNRRLKNQTPGFPTAVTDREREEFAWVIQRLPNSYLEVFHHAPYQSLPWVNTLIK